MVKRKRAFAGKGKAKAGGKKKIAGEAAAEAQDVASDDEESLSEGEAEKGKSDQEEDGFFETADEKRVRVAKEYLGRLGEERPPEQVQQQLAKDVQEQERRARVQVEGLSLGEPRFVNAKKHVPTCVCLTADEAALYSCGKDCAVVRWDVETGKKETVHKGGKNRFECGGHFARALSCCLVESRGLLLSAGADRLLRLWDFRLPQGSACVQKLFGHNGVISAVTADPDGTRAYTGAGDKSLKIWDLRARRCSDTLFGHVAGVSAMDIYNTGRPVTGGVDKTVRLWKLDKDTHLMFSKHTYPVDAVAVLDHDRFASASQDGGLMLWSAGSKKPQASVSLGSKSWIAALGAIRRGNVVFSGTVGGSLQAWRLAKSAEAGKGLCWEQAGAAIQASGSINSIAVGRRLLACAVAKEHRLGDWFEKRGKKDGLLLVPLSYQEVS